MKRRAMLGVRIISPDRPGIQAIRTSSRTARLLDWPPLLRELAAHLGIEKFRILGFPVALPMPWPRRG